MNVLIVSFRAPPFNSPGAVRIMGTANELVRLGFDVRVIGAANQGLPLTLDPAELAPHLRLIPWWDVNSPLNFLAGGKNRVLQIGDAALTPSTKGRLLLAGKYLYQAIFHVPDGQIGWVRAAIKDGISLAKDWKPDIVIGSALPASSLYAARGIAKRLGVPWIAEFRDLWTDNHYYAMPAWRRALDRLMEKRLLESAAAIVTVSTGLASTLRRKTQAPVEVILNGIDEAVVPSRSRASTVHDPLLSVVHTGQLIPGKRDPEPVLRALNLLGSDAENISLRFFGRRLDVVADELRRFPTKASVSVHDPVSRQSAIDIQKDADVLLLLLWNDPSERGVVTSKLFEYLAAGRPILFVGPADGEAADIVRECDAGFVVTQPEDIASTLQKLVRDKAGGPIPPRSSASVSRYLRSAQVAKLGALLHRIVAARSGL